MGERLIEFVTSTSFIHIKLYSTGFYDAGLLTMG